MSAVAIVPLKALRLASLAMAFAWGVIGAGVGLNALIKSNQQQDALRKLVPSPTVVHVDVNDIFQPGVIATTISLVIALLSLFFIILLLLPHRDSARSPLSTRTLPFQFGSLGFFTVWLFTVMIPFTQFFRTRSAKITAFVGPVQLPAASIAQAEQALGATTIYKHIHYLKLGAILTWFTFLFALIAAVISFHAYKRARSYISQEAKSPESGNASIADNNNIAEKNAEEKNPAGEKV